MASDFIRRTVKTPEQMQSDQEGRNRKAEESERLAKERVSHAREIEASWATIKETPAIIELLIFLASQRAALLEISVSGRGISKDESIISLSPDQRVSNLDRVAGLDIVINYIERITK